MGSSRLEEPTPSPSYLEDLKDLKEENAELREDNDKLLSYLDGLEERKKELEAIVASRSGKQIQDIVLHMLSVDLQMFVTEAGFQMWKTLSQGSPSHQRHKTEVLM